jgi:rare lipoprotein A
MAQIAFFSRRFSLYSATMSRALPLNSTAVGATMPARVKTAAVFFALLLAAGCSIPPSRVRVPERPATPLSQTGIASWYGPGFHGKATASGDVYNQNDLTAAHQTLPLGTRVIVTNLENGRSAEVTINDRGPFAKGRIIDLSYSAAQLIGMVGPGTALVRVDVIDSPMRIQTIRASLDYTLQLGSFAQLENARQLRDSLAKSYGEVVIAPLQSKDATYYRVQLGKFASRSDAEERARQVSQAGYSVIIMEQ